MMYVSFGRCVITKFVGYWCPAADVLAMSTTEVDLTKVPEGTTYVAKWRGSPVFVTHRTPEAIKQSKAEKWEEFRDPESDEQRCPNPKWLICQAVCTHFGCVPIAGQGSYGGYFAHAMDHIMTTLDV
eukprot:UN33543